MFARRIAVVGTGYVGLTTGACLASLGHRVVCADVDESKIERLRAGEIGMREDGLAELVSEGIAAGRLSFVVRAATALKELEAEGPPAEVMFLCVPTPMGVGGVADLAAVEAVIEETRAALPPGSVAVKKSTMAADSEFPLLHEAIATKTRQFQRMYEWSQPASAEKQPIQHRHLTVNPQDAVERVAR